MRALIGKGFRWFYCLPLPMAVGIMLVLGCGFVWLDGRFSRRKSWRRGRLALLLVWTALAVYATVGSRTSTPVGQPQLTLFHSYREVLAGGNPEILRSNLMNGLLFFPVGVLSYASLPWRWNKWVRVAVVMLAAALLSGSVEYLQYSRMLGIPEVDDILHNTLGALTGGVLSPLWRHKTR